MLSLERAAQQLALLAVVAVAALGPATAQAAGEVCAKVASPAGDDAAAGTVDSPYRTAGKLVNSLAAGETGCLRAGDYLEDEVTLRVPNTALVSYPGEQARVIGRLRTLADGVRVERLVLDGRNPRGLPSPAVNSDDAVFRRNDVSSPGGPGCFILGSAGEVQRPLIEANRIHDCGDPELLFGHGIYMQDVTGARIVGNTIYDNADRGIKVGPDAQGSLIRGNVIDGNAIGLNFSGYADLASSNNIVERNVIAYSTRWWNVQSYWPGSAVGQGNEVRFNCVFGGNSNSYYNTNGGISGGAGYSAHDNVVAEPRYLNRSAKDFRLSPYSPCQQVFDGCTKVASPTGSDQAAGTYEDPYRTVQRLVDSLAPGDTGCLRGGRFAENDEVTVSVPGTRLTRYPGERPVLAGRLRVTADGVVVDRLTLDGRNSRGLASPSITGDDVVFRLNNVVAPGNSGCFVVGFSVAAQRPLLEHNRIYWCGSSVDLKGDGVLLQNVSSARVLYNTIYDNGRRGITVGIAARDSVIRRNVIDGNPTGLTFWGDASSAATGNIVEHNVISNATRWFNVQSWWISDVVDPGNDVRLNCVFASNPDPAYTANGGISDGPGFTAHDNLVADPRYVDRAAKDFRLQPDSPCRAVY